MSRVLFIKTKMMLNVVLDVLDKIGDYINTRWAWFFTNGNKTQDSSSDSSQLTESF
ncbi:MAG: hypothetical protein ACK40M_14600 [Flavobacteriales bacterium]